MKQIILCCIASGETIFVRALSIARFHNPGTAHVQFLSSHDAATRTFWMVTSLYDNIQYRCTSPNCLASLLLPPKDTCLELLSWELVNTVLHNLQGSSGTSKNSVFFLRRYLRINLTSCSNFATKPPSTKRSHPSSQRGGVTVNVGKTSNRDVRYRESVEPCHCTHPT